MAKLADRPQEEWLYAIKENTGRVLHTVLWTAPTHLNLDPMKVLVTTACGLQFVTHKTLIGPTSGPRSIGGFGFCKRCP